VSFTFNIDILPHTKHFQYKLDKKYSLHVTRRVYNKISLWDVLFCCTVSRIIVGMLLYWFDRHSYRCSGRCSFRYIPWRRSTVHRVATDQQVCVHCVFLSQVFIKPTLRIGLMFFRSTPGQKLYDIFLNFDVSPRMSYSTPDTEVTRYCSVYRTHNKQPPIRNLRYFVHGNVYFHENFTAYLW